MENPQKAVQATVKKQGMENAGLADIKAQLMRYQDVVSRIDPRKGISIEATFTQCAILFASRPDLKKCTTQSLVGFAIQCVVLGLDPTPQRREAWAVPYKRKFIDQNTGQWNEVLECQFQLGYGGCIKLAMRSGIVSNIYAFAVYEGDQYQVVRGLRPDIIHVDGENSGDASKVIGAYACIVFKDGSKQFEAINKKQLERLRQKSPMQKQDKVGGMWETDYDEAARVKAIKRLLKFVASEGEWREDGDGAIITPESYAEMNGKGANTFDYAEVVDEPTQALPPVNADAQIPAMEKQPEKVESTKADKGDLSSIGK